MNILLADNQSRVRSALRLLLEQQAEAYRVEEADTLQGVLLCVKSRCPDILLLDWKLLGVAPEETLRDLQSSCPGLSIIAMDSNPQTGHAAREAGVNSFVSKNDPPERLLAAIKDSSDQGEKSYDNAGAYKFL